MTGPATGEAPSPTDRSGRVPRPPGAVDTVLDG
jgi:hypothetical protein